MKYETLHLVRLSILFGIALFFPIYYFVTSLDTSYTIFLFLLFSVFSYFIGKFLTIRLFVSCFGSHDKNDMLNYALSQIKLPYGSTEAMKEFLKRSYPKSSQEEIHQLEAECSRIFTFCINIPANDGTYNEGVHNQFPFLSKKVVDSLRGKALLIQERGGG